MSMNTYAALLRGINVGGNNKISMKKLKEAFESIGFSQVVTYINSGNIIFTTPKKDVKELTEVIERVIKKTFHLSVRVVLRDAKNIQKLAKKISLDWENDTEQRTDVLFLWEEFDKKSTLALIKSNPEVDRLMYIDGAIVWNFDREHYTKSGMKNIIGTTVYKNMTGRNINTVRKLASLMAESKKD